MTGARTASAEIAQAISLNQIAAKIVAGLPVHDMENRTMNDRSCEYDDPERSYRRGYQQGAYEALQAVRPRLLPSDTKKFENWVLMRLFRWRLKADVDETERIRPITSRQSPPSPPSL